MPECLQDRENEIVFDEPLRFLPEILAFEVFPVARHGLEVGGTAARPNFVDEPLDIVEESSGEV